MNGASGHDEHALKSPTKDGSPRFDLVMMLVSFVLLSIPTAIALAFADAVERVFVSIVYVVALTYTLWKNESYRRHEARRWSGGYEAEPT